MDAKEKITELVKDYVIDTYYCMDCHYWYFNYVPRICDLKCEHYSEFKPSKEKQRELNKLVKQIMKIK